MFRTEEEWVDEYTKKGAFWVHSGNASDPHAVTTTGKHSDGFLNSSFISSDIPLLQEAAADLVELLVSHPLAPFSRIVGPATGATELAKCLAKIIPGTTACSPTKAHTSERKRMVFTEEEALLICGRYALLCEDVVTTGESVLLAAEAVSRHEGATLPYVLALVNRSGQTHIDGKEIIALITRNFSTWEPHNCPLCPLGSKAIYKPKENWAALTRT